MNKVLITGASGFVGTNLVAYIKSHLSEVELILLSVRQGDTLTTSSNVYIHLAGKAHDTRNNIDKKEYYEANYLLTKTVFDAFLNDAESTDFIYMSSIKAIAENPENKIVDEEYQENINSVYGSTKKLAEQYILSNKPRNKNIFILRPCMIYGQGNKGNLNLLYKLVVTGFPWLLGAFENRRSFCSIENLLFVINEIMLRNDIPSGIYNIADDEPIATNKIISLIAESLNKKPRIWKTNKIFIEALAKFGDVFRLPLNTERLYKLTGNFVVSNNKIQTAIGKPFPYTTKQGLINTFNSFKKENG